MPNPTNTIMNVSATGVGVVGIDSATTAVTNTAEAEHKSAVSWQWDGPKYHLQTELQGQGQERPSRATQITQQSTGMQAGVCGVEYELK